MPGGRRRAERLVGVTGAVLVLGFCLLLPWMVTASLQPESELARFAAEMGLAVTVCHFPPGTSKWNKVEHRLFSHISTNWRGRPLVSHEVVVELIRATLTRSGLRVHAGLDRGSYPLGVRVSDRGAGRGAVAPPRLARGMELHRPPGRRIVNTLGAHHAFI